MPSHPSPKRVTIKDIGAHLGISHSTVSRALSDHPYTNHKTKARVHAAAKALGYVPHSAARVMRGGRSSLVGLVIPDVQNDFYSTVAKVMAQSCADAALQLVLAVTEDDPDLEFRHIRALCEAEAAGVIVTPSPTPRPETVRLLRHLPVLQLIRSCPDLPPDVISIDDEFGLFSATRHLIDLGHTAIGYIGGPVTLSTGAARLAGFRDALSQAGMDAAGAATELGPPRPEFGRRAFRRMIEMEGAPSAIVTAGSQLTLGVLEGARAAGMVLPRDISLVGFGDPPWSDLWGPGLTTLGLPVREIAIASGALLLQRIGEGSSSRDGPAATPVRARHSPHLIVRGSTAPPGARRKDR